MKYPHIKQHDEKDCGAACLSMISEFYGLKLSIAKFRSLIHVDNQGANIYGIVNGSKKIGFHADALEGDLKELMNGIKNGEIKFPFISRIVNEDMFYHFIVIYGIKKDKLIVGDPAKEHIIKMPLENFINQWQGQIIVFEKSENFKAVNQRKGSFVKYFKYVKNQKRIFALVFLISIIISITNIVSSTIFKYIIDDAGNAAVLYEDESLVSEEEHEAHEEEHEGSEDFLVTIEKGFTEIFSFALKNINTISIAIILLAIFRGLMQLLRGYMLSITAKRIEIPLTLNYYGHLIDLPPEFFGTRKTGELMSRFSDTSKIREAISTTTVSIMVDSVMAIIVGIYLFTISHILFLISLGIIAIYAIVVLLFRKPIKNINHNILEKEAHVESYLKESLDGIETIKTYQYEKSVKNKTEILFTKMINKVVKGSIIYVSQDAIVSTLTSIGTVCLLWVGTFLSMSRAITFGELFMYYFLLSYFLTPATNLIDLQPTIQTAMVAGERLNDILDVETEKEYNTLKSPVWNMNGDIKIENVDFRYGNRELVLKNINMDIKRGQKIAIVGESGCGKTTIAKLLMNFYSPEKGKIMINNYDISKYSPKSVREHIAYIPQNVFMFSDSIYNNLRMGNENISNKEIEKICELCCADEFIKNMPFGYETVLEEDGANLSTGQKQRLAIARALLKNPDILIMDEATGNLDVITEDSIRRMVEIIAKDKTCIIIAHRLKTIMNCDYIYVMNKEGTIIEQGTHYELMGNNGTYSMCYKM